MTAGAIGAASCVYRRCSMSAWMIDESALRALHLAERGLQGANLAELQRRDISAVDAERVERWGCRRARWRGICTTGNHSQQISISILHRPSSA